VALISRLTSILIRSRGAKLAGRLAMPTTGHEERSLSVTWWKEPWGTPWRLEDFQGLKSAPPMSFPWCWISILS